MSRVNQNTVGSFLLPPGFARPAVAAVLRESSVLTEVGRYAWGAHRDRSTRRQRPYSTSGVRRDADPVLLVPGFLAGDGSLSLMARTLRSQGFRTYRSQIRANVGCTLDAVAALEERLEAVAARRGGRVQIVGHSLGGMLARGLAVRRPDLVSGIVTMGSPMLAPGAHHVALRASVDVLVRLSRAGLPGLMEAECVAGECARASFEEMASPVSDHVGFTAIYSKRDGIVDWRACIDPTARPVEVTASHVGMAIDPRVSDLVVEALNATADASVLEVDRGISA